MRLLVVCACISIICFSRWNSNGVCRSGFVWRKAVVESHLGFCNAVGNWCAAFRIAGASANWWLANTFVWRENNIRFPLVFVNIGVSHLGLVGKRLSVERVGTGRWVVYWVVSLFMCLIVCQLVCLSLVVWQGVCLFFCVFFHMFIYSQFISLFFLLCLCVIVLPVAVAFYLIRKHDGECQLKW